MSNTWNSGGPFQQGLPNQVGQVKLFNPSQFQTPVTFENTQTSTTQDSYQQAPVMSVGQVSSSNQDTHTSWDNWSSWDWNSGQQQQQTQGEPVTSQQPQPVSNDGSIGNQYYNGAQYTTDWNPGYNDASQYAEQQALYGQSDGNAPFDPNQGQQYVGQSYNQFANQPQQFYDGQFYDQSQQQMQQPQQQNQVQVEDQGQGQAQDYYDQGHEQYQEQMLSYYGVSAASSETTWSSPDGAANWGGSFTQQQQEPLGYAEEDNGSHLEGQNSGSSIQQHHNNQPTSHDSESAGTQGNHNNDDDGTVSGFFGRDDDGNIDPPRLGRNTDDQNQGNDAYGFNRLLNVNTTFHRTSSDISNASLSTLNLSAGDEDDGRDSLQNVQELVKKMENVDLSEASHEQNSVGQSIYGQDELSQEVHQGTYSGFDHNIHTTPQTLPLDTGARSSSPDGDQPGSAESGGSGVSGGSSGLADWEIVPAQLVPKTSSRNSSPDNSVNFLSDKSDGGIHPSKGGSSHDMLHQEPQPFFPSTKENESIHLENRNLDTVRLFSQTNISSAPLHHEQVPQGNDPRGGDRRSGSPFVSSVTDNKDFVPTSVPQSTHASAAPLPPPSGLVSSGNNPYRRDHDRIPPQQATPASSTSKSSFLPPAPVVANKMEKSPFADKSQDNSKNTFLMPQPPKPKSGQSNEDGSRGSRHDSDLSIKPSDVKPALAKQTVIPGRKNSRDSEEVAQSSDHLRHHSAFHPVSRPRQTTMSPATTLWDNIETPATSIQLAPAMPLIIPGLAAVSSNTTSTPKTESARPPKSSAPEEKARVGGNYYSEDSLSTSRSSERRSERGRDGRSREDKNRSFDSLDEIDAVIDEPRDKSYKSSKDTRDYRDSRYGREPDVQPGRLDRPVSRSGQYQYERPVSRTDYGRDDPYRRQRTSYRDYGDSSFDERYDRPRSRQDEIRGSRPSSRSAHGQDADRSRSDYDRDYYYRDRNRGYGYENYNRNVDLYNEEKERWYRYYKDKEMRYARGYYEEYYGAKHAEIYQQHQQQQQLQQQQTCRSSRQEVDRMSNHSHSRGNTPGIAPSPAPGNVPPTAPAAAPLTGSDYYGHASRPTSRTDYNRDYYRAYGYQPYDPYYDVAGYGYDPYNYGYGYENYGEQYQQGYSQGRLTPPKYTYPHIRACFGPNGQLVKVLPNKPADGQPAMVEIQDVQSILESCPEAEELKQFPGPLTRVSTHKKDVLLFCQQKARACAEDISLPDRESAQLLWRFLELLIKQNGSVVGTDLSDLLLEGHEPSTHEYSLRGMKISPSLDALEEDNGEENNSARDSPAVRVTSDRTVIMTAEKERERWIDRFRHLLLYGRKKDALECAMKNHLWGHALFLASKMDTRTHANVMTRFANSAIKMNDPLQTLYQLMSGRQPAAVTGIVDERWGDWRPHLAMIVSNQTSRFEIDRKSICTLGDTLASKGYLHASHFCYLMAHVSFGTYSKKTSKIVLVGSSHNLPLNEFASNNAIQCTEVYEYAQVLGNAVFCLPHFQIYKYLYACKLVDYGMSQEALHYLEVIAANIQQYPAYFQPAFVKLVYQLSTKLKFSDPQRLQSYEDAEDPLWIKQLEKISLAYEDGSIQPVSGTATPAGFAGTTTSSESGDYNSHGYPNGAEASVIAPQSGAGDVYRQQQLYQPVIQQGPDQLSSGYYAGQDVTSSVQGQDTAPTQGVEQFHHQVDGAYAGYSQQAYDYSQWQQGVGYPYGHYAEQQPYEHQPGEQTPSQQQIYEQHNVSRATGEVTPGTSSEVTRSDFPVDDARVKDDVSHPGGTQEATHSQTQVPQGYYGYQQPENQLPQRASISTNETTEEEDDDDNEDEEVIDSSTGGFDYFGNVSGNQKVIPPPNRWRTMSESSTGSTRRRRTTSGSSTGSVKAAPYKTSPPSSQQPQQQLGAKDKTSQGQKGGGWFGGFFQKFRPKNEMILPDDKNPAIVWDPDKKKWINADGTEEPESTAPPPPKDMDLMGKIPAPAPSAVGPPPPTGLAGGNRFSLKSKAGGKPPQYVDVNNPKPLSVPQNLFNVMPPATAQAVTATPPQVFLPGSSAPANDTSLNTSNNSNQGGGQLLVPPTTDQSSSDTPAPSQQVPTMPVLFNPASLKSNAPGQSSAAGPGLKYGQRRAYPK
ncbi:protein transport protein Sec16A-like isoform X2 [Physella acuta]|uniref:protein transport protein Sec16A-like isoform X2 n=1 Tax=Physella acuta TaxID=109671 RepID=UPI0027DBA879|nr:protein transport protein Sec16A-like isoform X2 [Physella acuta]